ncbi:hypothetical protein SUGI_0573710 [Cryptomeria japonica]|nr:hypothetical protein SUGI_0573710 [Cryptomeria japonica]
MVNACLATFVLMLLSLSAILGTAENDGGRKAYSVHILKSMKPQHFNSHHQWYTSILDQIVQSDPSAKEMLYTYDTLLHGFAARLSEAEAQAMEAMDGCLAIIPSSLNKIATTHTPESTNHWSSLLWLCQRDIISISIGSPETPFTYDNRAIAGFGAIGKGFFFSPSAGNDGPSSSTLGNVAPLEKKSKLTSTAQGVMKQLP